MGDSGRKNMTARVVKRRRIVILEQSGIIKNKLSLE